MRVKITLVIISLCIFHHAFSQDILGLWRSPDSTRIYYVYINGGEIEACLLQSTRKKDRNGVLVLSRVRQINDSCYKGFIHAVSDGLTTFARIKVHGHEKDVLKLRLSRFLFPVRIRWHKVKDDDTAAH